VFTDLGTKPNSNFDRASSSAHAVASPSAIPSGRSATILACLSRWSMGMCTTVALGRARARRRKLIRRSSGRPVGNVSGRLHHVAPRAAAAEQPTHCSTSVADSTSQTKFHQGSSQSALLAGGIEDAAVGFHGSAEEGSWRCWRRRKRIWAQSTVFRDFGLVAVEVGNKEDAAVGLANATWCWSATLPPVCSTSSVCGATRNPAPEPSAPTRGGAAANI